MDKESFLHQFELSLTNRNKRFFAKIIYNLPADVIVGFTKEEFSRIICISHHFRLQKMDKLSNFLEDKGLFSLKKALKGIDELNNYLLSKFYYSVYVSLSENRIEKTRHVLINNAVACDKLADMGIDSMANLETAVQIYSDVKEILPQTNVDYAHVLYNEGIARLKLADMGIDSRENLETAVQLYGNAKEFLYRRSADFARVLTNEGIARLKLADMGIDSRVNLETAVSLHGNAQNIYPKTSTSYARSLTNEGIARLKLAEMDIDSKVNLETAVQLYGDAKEILPRRSADFARSLTNEGIARSELADMGIDRRVNLETAVQLYGDAKEILHRTSMDYARVLASEGIARSKLADMGIDRRVNFETAVRLYGDSKEIFPKTSADYARVLANEGIARSKLADMGIDIKENFGKSKELYLESVSVLERLGDRWAYSIALLNFNDLLKDNFYKTGEKKYLEEWEENLDDIEKKIKDRDIRYKERLMARIHEIRASLLEFDGKSGIHKASREYEKAYELSKDPFYKFMDEFCQARINTKSFCELVSDWKEVEKEDIFLDYFDYTVFECHLENSLKNTIDEENELKLAVEKLKEIRDRTQIKIIKDRVSAYIHLLQALIDCFNKDSYREAAKNVKEGCRIFREYGDKQGQEICDIFHNAVVKNKDPDAWQEIIRDRRFSSNFYSLLCEYSNRKRIDLEFYLSGQLHTKVNTVFENVEQIKEISIRIENKIDEMLNQIRSGFTEIKDQIGKGFKGTDAELQQIRAEVNNSQQDLEYLVQISNNNVDSREGEYIREFTLQMLELMKKGDYEALKRFSEKIVQNNPSITEIIEAANIPEKEKAEVKSKLADLKKIPGILKEKTKSFTVDVTKDIVVTLTSGEIIKLLTPVLSTAIFGVPMPSQIVGILLEAIRNS